MLRSLLPGSYPHGNSLKTLEFQSQAEWSGVEMWIWGWWASGYMGSPTEGCGMSLSSEGQEEECSWDNTHFPDPKDI